MSRLVDVVPDAQNSKEPDDQEFGSYCFEELEPAKVMETISTEVIELTDSSEDSKCLEKSRKSLDKQGVTKTSTDENKTHGANSEFQEHSQTLRKEMAIETFEIKFEEKPAVKRTLLSGSEFREHSQESRMNPCIEITEQEDLREIKLPLKPKQLKEL